MELKFQLNEPKPWAKVLISAFDAVLDAEKEFGMQEVQLQVTVTWSTALCPACVSHGNIPAVGQMAELRNAMENPAAYGYTPRNNLMEAYSRRFVNSFNTQAPAEF